MPADDGRRRSDSSTSRNEPVERFSSYGSTMIGSAVRMRTVPMSLSPSSSAGGAGSGWRCRGATRPRRRPPAPAGSCGAATAEPPAAAVRPASQQTVAVSSRTVAGRGSRSAAIRSPRAMSMSSSSRSVTERPDAASASSPSGVSIAGDRGGPPDRQHDDLVADADACRLRPGRRNRGSPGARPSAAG